MRLMRLEEDVVVEIVDVPDTIAGRPSRPDEFFHHDLNFVLHENGAEVGMVKIDGTWVLPE